MVAKKKKKSGQLSLKIGMNDERIPKLVGMGLLFLAIYLFIAFTSHLFTWKVDQDTAYEPTWDMLMNPEIEVQNWLGRLGAIISNIFFFWGFGIPSYIFVLIFTRFGIAFIKHGAGGWRSQMGALRASVIFMLILSIFLEFVFGGSEFPWGGAFGMSVSTWMTSFVGTVGMIALFIFAFFGFLIWTFNPSYHDLSPNRMRYNAKVIWEDIQSGQIWKPKRKAKMPSNAVKEQPKALKPGNISANKEDEKTVATPKTPPKPKTAEENQLSFELEKDEKKPEKKPVLDKENAELEIEKPNPEPGEAPTSIKNPFDRESTNPEEDLEPYDPTLELSTYEHPVLALLEDYSDQKVEIDRSELENNKDQIIETLLNYKIEITKIKATIGPTVTLYEIIPAPGVRISKIKNLEDDIALSLAALGIRIIAPIPGRGTIGIEVPNKNKQIVSLKEVLASEQFKRGKMELPIALGKTISNEVFIADLAKMPHLLIAGATGQGKSVGINTVITSLLYKKHPSQVKFVLIDPKKVELFPYSKLENHFLTYLPNLDEPIVTDTTKVIHTLNSLLIEMEQRYNLLKKAHSRNIKEYNTKFVARKLNPEKGHRFMPFIVLIIDEFADLIMTAGKEVELPIGRLAQLSRAVGIHLIIATQRPSVNIITGVIKANFPARIAFKVISKVDSRTILDTGGADRLIGRGDMLLSFGSDLIRLQCAFIDTPEVERVINFISEQQAFPTPYFLPEFVGDDAEHQDGGFSKEDLDEMFPDAARLVVQNQHGSTSMIQRRLKLGYNRAGRIMDQLESFGIVGPSEGSKAREVLFYDEMELERFLEDLKK